MDRAVFFWPLIAAVAAVIAASSLRTAAYITIGSIFFPLYVGALGRDVVTSTTLFILIVYGKHFIRSYNRPRSALDVFVFLLLLSGTVSAVLSVVSVYPDVFRMGYSVRHYLGFASAILLFLLLEDSGRAAHEPAAASRGPRVNTVLSLVLILTAVHVVISIGVKYVPSLGSAFALFVPKGEVFDIPGRGSIERMGSFALGGAENYGELLAVLAPIVVYKMFSGRLWWGLCLMLFALGEIFSVTRSGILLMAAGTFIAILVHGRSNAMRFAGLAYVLTGALLGLVFLLPGVVGDMTERFGLALQTYDSTGDFFEAINRAELPRRWEDLCSELSLFGRGFVPTPFGHGPVHFHNLVLTTLYRLGAVGCFLFLLVAAWPAGRLMRRLAAGRRMHAPLAFSCLLSMALLGVNEMKFEFTREAPYQQLIWALLGVFASIGQTEAASLPTGEDSEGARPDAADRAGAAAGAAPG
ncbi:MAG: hypothetical protein AB1640_23325 [bacterium]